MPTEKWVRYLHDAFGTMRYVPIAFITGQTGKNVKALLNHAQMLFKQSRARVSTGQLNRMLREAVRQKSAAVAQQPRSRRFTTPRRSASSRRRSCCSCNDPSADLASRTSAICWASSATS